MGTSWDSWPIFRKWFQYKSVFPLNHWFNSCLLFQTIFSPRGTHTKSCSSPDLFWKIRVEMFWKMRAARAVSHSVTTPKHLETVSNYYQNHPESIKNVENRLKPFKNCVKAIKSVQFLPNLAETHRKKLYQMIYKHYKIVDNQSKSV